MSLGLLLLLLYFIFRPKVNKLQEILKNGDHHHVPYYYYYYYCV